MEIFIVYVPHQIVKISSVMRNASFAAPNMEVTVRSYPNSPAEFLDA
jgi:hypothetical protein